LIDTTACVIDSWHRLGFQGAAEITNTTWVTLNELYQYATDAISLLARSTGVFLTYDASIAVSSPTSTYALPAGHVFTESAWLAGGAQLRITPVADLFALDQAWSLTSGAPSRVSFDAAGPSNAVVYPIPNINGTLAQVMGSSPPTVTNAAPTVAAPSVLQDMVTYFILSGARGKESDSSMMEVAEHARDRVKMYLSIAQQYWGTGR
jgi:hypothetical protein